MEEGSIEDTPASQRLTNEDFRRLLMTPRATPSGSTPSGSVREVLASAGSMPPPTENKSELRRKKKSYYAALKKQEDHKLAELSEKYRDRARERRDGVNDKKIESVGNTNSAYRAVAPDVKSGMDAKERRRQIIQESKYLGGDMEHTHLVKGLDYALLQKIRSEIQTRETEEELEMERLVSEPIEEIEVKKPVILVQEEEMQFVVPMARNIYNLITEQKAKKVTRREVFAPGRTAYIVGLDEESTVESDIPTTLTRSKAEVPETDDGNASATNDIVLEKLTQIFSYLRNGRHRRLRKLKVVVTLCHTSTK